MKMVKWLASFDDRGDAERFAEDQAKFLTRMSMAYRYGVKLTFDDGKYHVELWEYDQ